MKSKNNQIKENIFLKSGIKDILSKIEKKRNYYFGNFRAMY